MFKNFLILSLFLLISLPASAEKKYIVKTKDGKELSLSRKEYKELKKKIEAKKREEFMKARREKLHGKAEGPVISEDLDEDIEFIASDEEPVLETEGSIKLEPAPQVTMDEKLSEIDQKRRELQENEKRTLEFIYPSIEAEEEELAKSDEYFTNNEKEQLLELWRATIARNRTIQFLIKILSPDQDMLKQNNAIVQGLSKAIFVPFYAVTAVSNNALIDSGTSVGARVLGDVVEDYNAHRSRTREITHTEMVVMFMMVDEVAERLRSSYRDYKEYKVEHNLMNYELKEAQFEATEALNLSGPGSESAKFFTRMVVRNIQRQIRNLSIQLRSKRRKLIELAGQEAVSSVDVLIDLETESELDKAIGL